MQADIERSVSLRLSLAAERDSLDTKGAKVLLELLSSYNKEKINCFEFKVYDVLGNYQEELSVERTLGVYCRLISTVVNTDLQYTYLFEMMNYALQHPTIITREVGFLMRSISFVEELQLVTPSQTKMCRKYQYALCSLIHTQQGIVSLQTADEELLNTVRSTLLVYHRVRHFRAPPVFKAKQEIATYFSYSSHQLIGALLLHITEKNAKIIYFETNTYDSGVMLLSRANKHHRNVSTDSKINIEDYLARKLN